MGRRVRSGGYRGGLSGARDDGADANGGRGCGANSRASNAGPDGRATPDSRAAADGEKSEEQDRELHGISLADPVAPSRAS